MIPISTPFQIDKNNSQLVGIDGTRFREFLKLCFDYCKNGKIYHFSVKEITAAEVQRNYLFLCLSMAAEETGQTPESLRAYFEKMCFDMSCDKEDEFFKESEWVNTIVDLDGEIKGKSLVHLSQWTSSMMYDFIQLVQGIFLRQYPDFKFPNPEDYTLPKVGRKNVLPFPELVMKIKF